MLELLDVGCWMLDVGCWIYDMEVALRCTMDDAQLGIC